MATLHTALCDLLAIRIPIIQAPMAVATPALAAAVSSAGGLGMLGLANRDPDGIRRVITETRRLTDRPFGVNFRMRKSTRGWPRAWISVSTSCPSTGMTLRLTFRAFTRPAPS